jgi:hypothetical protein
MLGKDALLTAALEHAARGWRVFPLVPDSKRPAVDRWEHRATTDPARIRSCWRLAPFGIGIACGPSGLLVVDLDRRKPGQHAPTGHEGYEDGADVLNALCRQHGQPWPGAAYTVETGSGGAHLYYRHPEVGPPLRNTAARIGWLIDTRAHGGYVVAAGSTVAGRPYRTIVDGGDPHQPPGWLVERMRPAEPARPIGPMRPVVLPAGRRGAYLRAAVERTQAKLGEAREGERNAALFMAAQTLGQLVAGGALTEPAVVESLTRTALRIGLGERETARTIRSGLAFGALRPRPVAA